jgi:serine/threonine protein kinase
MLRQLGEGGMGVVFEAEDARLKRKVALKVMRPEAAAHPQGRARILREAEAVAALSHDHIVTILDVGEERGVPFFVMPLLQGESLQERLARHRLMPVAEAVLVGREVAEGLAAAHAAGLIHRDVKPGNVWLEAPNDRVKLLDFGLARAAAGDARLTRTGAVLGTPAFMAPEQAGGKPGHRADLFSQGAVLYEMLTGRRPFPGETVMEVLAAVLRERPPAPASVNPTVPAALSALVMALLEREPGQRPATARQVAALLREAGPTATVPPPLPQAARLSTTSWRPPRARRLWWPLALGAAGLLVLFWLALAALRPAREAPGGDRAATDRDGPPRDGQPRDGAPPVKDHEDGPPRDGQPPLRDGPPPSRTARTTRTPRRPRTPPRRTAR